MSISRKGAFRQSDGKSYGAVNTRDDGEVSHTAPPYTATVNNDRLRHLQTEVNDVKGILQDDIEKLVERDGKVNTLNERAEDLINNSTKFKKDAVRVRKDAQRRNWKYIACLVCVVVVVLAIIAIIVLYALKVI